MKFSKEEVKDMGDQLNIDWNKYDLDQVYKGVGVELEHGTKGGWNITDDNLEKTVKIALAHLKEIPDYYTRLDEMEKAGKKAIKEGELTMEF